jgi:hypothetical protein
MGGDPKPQDLPPAMAQIVGTPNRSIAAMPSA